MEEKKEEKIDVYARQEKYKEKIRLTSEALRAIIDEHKKSVDKQIAKDLELMFDPFIKETETEIQASPLVLFTEADMDKDIIPILRRKVQEYINKNKRTTEID